MPQSKAIPSIDDQPDIRTKLIREDFPLPKGRQGVLAAVERILAGGGVQKFTVELGQPIKVLRRIRADLPGDEVPEDLYEDDMMAAAMNAEMEDFPLTLPNDISAPFHYLFRAFSTLMIKKCVPKAILVNKVAVLKKWLGVDTASGVYGVEVFQHKEVPDDVLVLVGSKADEPDVIAHSLRLEMLFKEKS